VIGATGYPMYAGSLWYVYRQSPITGPECSN
jgi:hypothetical protein